MKPVAKRLRPTPRIRSQAQIARVWLDQASTSSGVGSAGIALDQSAAAVARARNEFVVEPDQVRIVMQVAGRQVVDEVLLEELAAGSRQSDSGNSSRQVGSRSGQRASRTWSRVLENSGRVSRKPSRASTGDGCSCRGLGAGPPAPRFGRGHPLRPSAPTGGPGRGRGQKRPPCGATHDQLHEDGVCPIRLRRSPIGGRFVSVRP